MTVKKPWLIQRAKINKDPVANATLSESVRLGYMGSSEFEFGTLPTCLRGMHARADTFDIQTLSIFNYKGEPLFVAGALKAEDVPAYLEMWKSLTSRKYPTTRLTQEAVDIWGSMIPPPAKVEIPNYLKRATRAEKDRFREQEKEPRTDFWWDLDNGLILSFNRDYMSKLPSYLEASWAVMDKLAPTGIAERSYAAVERIVEVVEEASPGMRV